MSDIKTQIAKALLDIEAVFLRPDEPFTWASGIKSPIYCDNRLILTAPEVRNMVENAIADTVKREYPDVEVHDGHQHCRYRSCSYRSSYPWYPYGLCAFRCKRPRQEQPYRGQT